jgi:hypothetical protein
MNEARVDQRRYARARVAWKIMIETPGSRPRIRKTVDISPFGVRVRLDERFQQGAPARLRLSAPGGPPLQFNAVVLRIDAAGPVFVFVGVSDGDVTRMKSLVDSYQQSA